jgi:hypothetical protein
MTDMIIYITLLSCHCFVVVWVSEQKVSSLFFLSTVFPFQFLVVPDEKNMLHSFENLGLSLGTSDLKNILLLLNTVSYFAQNFDCSIHLK